MFYSVSLFSQAPLARGSRALPSVLFIHGLAILFLFNFIHSTCQFCGGEMRFEQLDSSSIGDDEECHESSTESESEPAECAK